MVEFTSSTDDYLVAANAGGTTDLDTFSICFWFRRSQVDTYNGIFELSDGSGGYNSMAFGFAGSNLQFISSGGATFNIISSVTLDEWYFVALASGTGAAGYNYSAAEGAASLTSDFNGSWASSSGTTELLIGGTELTRTDDKFVGHIVAFKAWAAELSEEEFEREMYSFQPRRTADLGTFLPLTGTLLDDWSGNGNAASQQSTGAVSDGGEMPSISFASSSIQELVLADEVGGVSLTQTAIETLAVADSNGTSTADQSIAQPAIETLVVASSDGTVQAGEALELTQPDPDAPWGIADYNGTVLADISLTQPAIETLVIADSDGIVMVGEALELTQPTVETLVIVDSTGTVSVDTGVIQPVIETIEIVPHNGVVSEGGSIALIQTETELVNFVTDPGGYVGVGPIRPIEGGVDMFTSTGLLTVTSGLIPTLEAHVPWRNPRARGPR